MQIYDFTVGVNGSFSLQTTGRYFKYLSGNAGGADPTITITSSLSGGQKSVLAPGQAIKYAKGSTTGFSIGNYAGSQPIIGKVLVGDDDFYDATLQGTVSVVDGGKFRTLSGSAFAAYGSQVAVAGQCSRVQLWNPASNPNRLVVEQVNLAAGTSAQSAALVFMTVALATNMAVGYAKKSGAPNSVAQINIDSIVAVPTEPELLVLGCSPNNTQAYKLNEPIIVLPGYGLTLYGGIPNALLGSTFEWYEETNQ